MLPELEGAVEDEAWRLREICQSFISKDRSHKNSLRADSGRRATIRRRGPPRNENSLLLGQEHGLQA
jgi:hypothetical protein